jgi:ketosteroid isomerase-like protein
MTLTFTGCNQTASAPETKAAEAKPVETKPTDKSAKDIADIKALEDRFIKAVSAKDVNAIMSVYVSDSSLFVFDVIPPRQYVGADAYRKDWEEFLGLFPGPIDFGISDLEVTAAGGDLAWSHSIQHLGGAMKDGKKMDLTVRTTDGYKRVNGQWLVALEHVSVPVDVLTGKSDLTSKP